MTSGVCIHGGLRRQCEACDLADQLEQMTADRDRLRAALRELLTCSLPHDISGVGIIERARAALAPPAQEGK